MVQFDGLAGNSLYWDWAFHNEFDSDTDSDPDAECYPDLNHPGKRLMQHRFSTHGGLPAGESILSLLEEHTNASAILPETITPKP